MKKYIKIILLCCILTFFSNKSVFSWSNINKNTDVAVVIKEDGIWAININNSKEKILLKEGENFKYPLISKEGYVAFKNDNNDLYIAKIDFNKTKGSYKVSDDVSSYNWDKEGNLIFSKFKGGLYYFKNKSIEIIKEGKEFYSQITLGKGNLMFAIKGIINDNNSNGYPLEQGIIELDLISKEEKIIVPYKPVNPEKEDLGVNPGIAAISNNGTYLIIWLRTNSASMTADGVPLGIYNTINKEFKEVNKDIVVLTYADMISVSPVDENLIALINGSSRTMNMNKTLGIFDIKNESFKAITKDNEVAMTPSYSSDGSKIIYSASPSNEDMKKWEESFNQSIYEVNTKNNEIMKLTNSKNGFDFFPKYINDNEFIFIRKDKNSKFSLIKGNKNQEEQIIIDNMINPKDKALEQDFWYYGHYNINKIFDYMKIT